MPIQPEEYRGAEVLAREQQLIFGGRVFVGSAGRLSAPDAYRAYFAGNRALVTRWANGAFHTLENVCLHRGNLIHPPGYGAQPFRCAYHAWQYDSEGALHHAPLSDPTCISRRQLQAYPTANLDGLLFADLRGRAPDLADAHSVLARIGFAPAPESAPFHSASMPHQANWKLLVENVLEAYHVSFLHGPTLVAQGYSSAGSYDWAQQGDCSWHVMTPKEAADTRMRRLLPEYQRGYAHAYIPPNLFVAVTAGLIAYVGHFLPISADTTLLDYELYETQLLRRQKQAIREYFKEQAVAFSAASLEEDRALLESSQIGIAYARTGHQLQPIEARVGHFHKIYREAMDAI
jgi:phenylpropionate dioxygenase-like ring-hydroxylating dioxygenase large terminal subunit